MTNKISYLDDGEFCIIKKDQIDFFNNDGSKINKKIMNLSNNEINYDKGDYKYFMEKEIAEQPKEIEDQQQEDNSPMDRSELDLRLGRLEIQQMIEEIIKYKKTNL